MSAFGSSRTKLRRLIFSRQSFIALLLVHTVLFISLGRSSQWSSHIPLLSKPPAVAPERMTNTPPLPPLSKRIPCYGPRGKLLSNSPDDALDEVELKIPYPIPWTGSHEALGLDKTWMTADGRYGPYGFGEQNSTYKRSRVEWDKLNWQQLQKQCFTKNARRFPKEARMDDSMLRQSRFRYRNASTPNVTPQWHEFNPTRRTAIVVRTWRGYEYMDEDLHYIRSLVVEAALKTGGEYQVILLVDMKDYEIDIFASEPNYLQALDDSGVPPEFESMAVLWDDRLLESWYPLVEEHRTMWQVFQPMQIFTLHYPEFDHFWQLELDMRFTGDAGKYFDSLHDFSRKEPRKQAFERSLFQHMQQKSGDYKAYFDAVDKANNASAALWGPLHIPEIKPIGPKPPVELATDDKFEWGVGEEADVIVTATCGNVLLTDEWVFRHWIGGFKQGLKTPRFWCPPAVMRASRTLYLAVHEAQVTQGLQIPSEATLPSFALWHGLKMSFPQHPVYFEREHDDDYQELWWRGGPDKSTIGAGPDKLPMVIGLGLSYWWQSGWPRQIMDAWEGRKLNDDVHFPWVLAKDVYGGKVYIPNMVLHPVKHNT